ncbi:MscS Mechanosensitive ion channel [Fructilactobacillus fructivorans]|nr:MscS Mechanosensitive ion channel [Fructilactobacillus fructivorans]KRN40750.1 MscS Mechanosensitive ion channel [Fructilactobacillus fructivorans]KRN42430.1 MscS Mechanosensitive ion channel [Fructilactobacillus fructivorans]
MEEIMNIFIQLVADSAKASSALKSGSVENVANPSFLTKYFRSFNWTKILSNLTTKIVSIILVSILFLIIVRVGKTVIKHFFNKRQTNISQKKDSLPKINGTSEPIAARRNKTMYTLATNIYYYTVIFFWLYSILSMIGIPVGTLLAGAGIFSLAIGLGAQGFVSDIVSGFFILFEHQIDVGERVIINNIEGYVKAVGIRTTQITSINGTLNFIQNRNITTVSNLSRGEMMTIVNIRITPETPIHKVEDIIASVNEEKCPNDPDIVGKPVIFGTNFLEDGSLAISVFLHTKSEREFDVNAKYLGAYLTAIYKAGINLPLSPLVVPAPPQKTN